MDHTTPGYRPDRRLGDDPKGFFFGEFLGLSSGALELGSLRPTIFGAVTLAWGITWLACVTGVRAGIERAGKVLMPVLFLLVLVFTLRVVWLDGAVDGVTGSSSSPTSLGLTD
jgi:NSS family neurotransmitter:Na+ symporter